MQFSIIYMLISEKAMAPHSSTLAWKIPWMEEPGGLQSMGSLRVGHDWATSLSLFTFMHWRRKWQPTPVFLPGESQGWGAWWAAVSGVAQSRTRLKWLSSTALNLGGRDVKRQYKSQCWLETLHWHSAAPINSKFLSNAMYVSIAFISWHSRGKHLKLPS